MNSFDSGKPIRILLIEDNPGDVRLMEEALKEGKLSVIDVLLEIEPLGVWYFFRELLNQGTEF